MAAVDTKEYVFIEEVVNLSNYSKMEHAALQSLKESSDPLDIGSWIERIQRQHPGMRYPQIHIQHLYCVIKLLKKQNKVQFNSKNNTYFI